MNPSEARAKAIQLATKYYGGNAASNEYIFQQTVEKFYLYITTGRWDR